MSTVREELAYWAAAVRGALEWHAEVGEPALEVPAGFTVPPLGTIEQIAPPVVQVPTPSSSPAPTAVEPEAEPAPEAKRSFYKAPTPVPGGPPLETTFLDSPSLLEGPAEANLVCGWCAVRVAFIAGPTEAPGAELLEQVGALVQRMATGIGLGLGQVFFGYLTGPGGERPAAPAARRAVRAQLAVARPDVIVALGDFAARTLCGSSESFKRTRGQWHDFEGVPVMPTFHPEALLQHQSSQRLKAVVWDDLKKVMRSLDLKRGPQ